MIKTSLKKPMRVPALIFIAGCSLILIFDLIESYKVPLNFIGVPTWETLFFDLEQIIVAAKNSTGSTLGKDGSEIVSKAWLPFSYFSLKYLNVGGTLLGIMYVISSISIFNLYKSSKKFYGIYFGLLLTSYVSWFAIERGQPDLIIFLLLYASILFHRHVLLSFLLILYATLLKFFPIGTIILFWNKNLKRSLGITSIFLMVFACFLWYDWNTIQTIISFQNRVFGNLTWKSFGANNIFNLISSTSLGSTFGFGLADYKPGSILAIVLFLIIGITRIKPIKHLNISSDKQNYAELFFLLGAIVYIASFIIGRNFDYKLVFLIFCIPYFFQSAEKAKKSSTAILSWISLVCIIILFWSGLFGGEFLEGIRDSNLNNTVGLLIRWYLNGFNLLKEILTWVLFVTLSSAMLHILPGWFSSLLRLKKPLPQS